MNTESPVPAPAEPPMRPRRTLQRRLAWTMALLAAAGPLTLGSIEGVVATRAAFDRAALMQHTQARDVAFAIETMLGSINAHVGAVTALPWGLEDQFSLEMRRAEYGRLLRLVPALESLGFHAADGRLLVHVSRRELDRVARPGGEVALDAAAPRGGLSYRDNYEPVFAHEARFEEPAAQGRTLATINLRLLSRSLGEWMNGALGSAYVVDEAGTVLLHREADTLLARARLSAPPVPGGESARAVAGLGGLQVLRSTAPVKGVPWTVVVEQSRDTLLAPVWAGAARTAALTLLAVLLSAAVAVLLARRISLPVRQLHAASRSLALGRWDTRIRLHSADELEDLGQQFNTMAANLQTSVSELEERVAQRTSDLVRANRHKSEFLANMSHELRTPLNAILGFSDVLRDGMAGPLADEQREYIGDIHASGMHLLALINDVLDISKIEAGQLELDLAEFDLLAMLDGAAALMRQRLVGKRQSFRLDVPTPAGVWYGDERRLKQVVLNLLSNAVKFTPEGGEVSLQARITGEPGSDAECLQLVVQDTGVGISPEDQARVFDEFVQLGRGPIGRASRAEGTGLGLALVRRLVQQHGGQIALQSRLDEGSTFTVVLPRLPRTAGPGPASATPVSVSASSTTPGNAPGAPGSPP